MRSAFRKMPPLSLRSGRCPEDAPFRWVARPPGASVSCENRAGAGSCRGYSSTERPHAPGSFGLLVFGKRSPPDVSCL